MIIYFLFIDENFTDSYERLKRRVNIGLMPRATRRTYRQSKSFELCVRHRWRHGYACTNRSQRDDEAAHAPSTPPDHVVRYSAATATVPCVTRYVVRQLRCVSSAIFVFHFVFYYLFISHQRHFIIKIFFLWPFSRPEPANVPFASQRFVIRLNNRGNRICACALVRQQQRQRLKIHVSKTN